jgi:nucleotide-binding universal stress UspA family protein
MSTILACTDGSIYAPSVYDHTAWAAQRLGAAVHVLHMLDHVAQPAPADVSGSIGFDASAELMAELITLAETQGRVAQAKGRALLAEAQRHLVAAGVAKVSSEQQHGALPDAIARLESGSELVVIGKRGEHADFAKLHLGSNLERVIRSSHHPVLVASRAFQPIERFLIAYDGGPSTKKAVDYVATQALLKGLFCHVLTVGADKPELRADLDSVRDRLTAAGYGVSTELLPGSRDTVIADTVKRHRINLMVMGAYGHSRIRQFIVGSTTTTTIRTVHIPVLMFR